MAMPHQVPSLDPPCLALALLHMCGCMRGALQADPFDVIDFEEHDVVLQLAFVGGAMHLYALVGTLLFFPMLSLLEEQKTVPLEHYLHA